MEDRNSVFAEYLQLFREANSTEGSEEVSLLALLGDQGNMQNQRPFDRGNQKKVFAYAQKTEQDAGFESKFLAHFNSATTELNQLSQNFRLPLSRQKKLKEKSENETTIEDIAIFFKTATAELEIAIQAISASTAEIEFKKVALREVPLSYLFNLIASVSTKSENFQDPKWQLFKDIAKIYKATDINSALKSYYLNQMHDIIFPTSGSSQYQQLSLILTINGPPAFAEILKEILNEKFSMNEKNAEEIKKIINDILTEPLIKNHVDYKKLKDELKNYKPVAMNVGRRPAISDSGFNPEQRDTLKKKH